MILASASRAPSPTLAARILDCFPGGAYALSALLRLMDIVESDAVPTAAVECRAQPRLLINPAFVARHAGTSEKLLMLVMHELHHVLLGHTTLFPTVTPARNFVFDAVINGIICRMFPEREYTSLLTEFYDQASFPHCLLRPPPGWPEKPRDAAGIDVLPKPQRSTCREVHRALYAEGGATYKEVFDMLPGLVRAVDLASVPLLGGHDADGAAAGELERRSPVLFDVVRGIVEQWPQPPDPIRGRSLADVLKTTRVKPLRRPSNRRLLRALIAKVADRGKDGPVRRAGIEAMIMQQPIPTLDRRTLVQRALGHTPLLHAGPLPFRRITKSGERVRVYLDVSGSMTDVRSALYGAILDSGRYVHPTVHLFSSKVADVSLEDLRRGACKTTGGTDIACVAAHIDANRVKRALIVTDGWVGRPSGRHREILVGARLAVAFLGTGINGQDLREVADFTAVLKCGD